MCANIRKLIDIINGIISENGRLSNSFWKDNMEEELDEIASTIKTIDDIRKNKDKIIKNFNDLLDGLNGWTIGGRNISKFGSISNIDKSFFK